MAQRVKKPGTPMPADFALDEAKRAFFRNYFSPCRDSDIQLQFDKFKNKNEAEGTLYVNWDAAWRTWVLNLKQWGYTPGGIGPRPVNTGAAIEDMKRAEAEQLSLTPQQIAANRKKLAEMISGIGRRM